MKKFLIILGSITLFLIILVVGYICYAAFRGHQLDVSSKAYVDANVPIFISSWSKDALLKLASKELQKNLTDQQWVLFIAKVKHLGKFQIYEGCKGQAYISLNFQNGKAVTAYYTASMSFQNGPAEAKVKLIQRNGQWQIIEFTVDSPIFYK